MKRTIILFVLIILVAATSAHAQALFEDAYLSQLRLVNVDQEEGRALIQDLAGNQSDVWIGDALGWEQAVVVAMEQASILVEQEDLRTRIPVVNPFSGN